YALRLTSNSLPALYYIPPQYSAPPPHPHSFPTRRSSDLLGQLASNGPALLGLAVVQPALRDGEQQATDLRAFGKFLLQPAGAFQDRKSTRLNSSHEWISYAVFCLKKKNKKYEH